MEPPKEEGTTVLSGSFDFTATLPNQAQLALHGYIYANDTPAEINARVDRFQDVAQRTMLRAGLEGLRANRRALMVQLENQREWLAGMVEKKTAGAKLTSQEKQAVENGQNTIDGGAANIAKIDKDIADLEERLKTQV